ncbi:hypothetical protein M231_05438 [Tremella mesenterica]|uniref:cAMP-independent regulatory protein n=1 Tax=Tremella mesenterica TaxID=5217 RepID=A0A4Q1BI81_TREME|nr:hypothetical protein M231_05438 [Tremella mesenterica]
MTQQSPPPPHLDPPFRGYIETTFDALLVFEAARRGMIPRVTRRLIERERGMVQSGAVFVFDEHESGIKRWTDGLIWSPSRILGNFLVYRETDKRANPPPTPMSNNANSTSPSQTSPAGTPGALNRNRSASDAQGMSRHRERQLVGSLTNSHKFKEGGLVKKTMSVTVNGFAQHMISYYTCEDVLAGKLRCPSSIPELAALEISPEYLHKQNFRFPPMIEVGPDGVPRYRGEPEEPSSPQSPVSTISMHSSFPPGDMYDPYSAPVPMQSPSQRHRSVTVPMPIPMPPSGGQYGGGYMDQNMYPPGGRPGSSSSIQSGMSPPNPISGPLRPQSSSRRYEAFGPPNASPRQTSGQMQEHARRTSQQIYYPGPSGQGYDVKPNIHQGGYSYQPPSTAPGAFADFYGASQSMPGYPAPPPHAAGQQSYSWGSSAQSRLLPTRPEIPSTAISQVSSNQNGPQDGQNQFHPSQNSTSGPTTSGSVQENAGGGQWNGHVQGWEHHGHPTHPTQGQFVGSIGEEWRPGQSLAS